VIEIDNVVLFHYIERLSNNQKAALISAANVSGGYGMTYAGPEINIHLPFLLLEQCGVPQLRPSHFVAGGFLTPVGLRLAKLLTEVPEDDDYRL